MLNYSQSIAVSRLLGDRRVPAEVSETHNPPDGPVRGHGGEGVRQPPLPSHLSPAPAILFLNGKAIYDDKSAVLQGYLKTAPSN